MPFRLTIKIWFFIGLSYAVCATNAFAEEKLTLDELLQLDIVDLSKVKINVASKRDEYVADAPSVVSVVTARQIKQFGAKNLNDVLNRVTSVQATGSHFYPHVINMRGQLVGHNNSDILFLINGRPRRTSWNGGTPFSLLLAFPLDTIERIEIIRGPGSVLYGTGAFTGVINIITKSEVAVEKTRVAGTYGSYDSGGAEVTTAVDTEDFKMMTGVKYYQTEGWDYSLTDENNVYDTVNVGEKNTGVMLTGESGDFSLNALYTEADLDNNIGGPPRWPAGDKDATHLTLDLGYQYHFSPDWKLDNHITYNKFDFQFQDTPPVNNTRYSRDVLGEVTLFANLTENLNWILGTTYEDISGNTSDTLTYSSYRYSMYTQFDYRFSSDQKLTLGVQYNKVEHTDADTSPRLAYVTKFNQEWGGKLLYSQAFRSAVATERFLDSAVVGDPSLNPEKITTAEAQVFYTSKNYYAALTYFNSEINDVINRINSGGVFYFVNEGTINSDGYELEGNIKISSALTLIASVTYQHNEDANGLDASLSPTTMAKLGVSYESSGYTLGVFDSYFDDPTPVREVNPGVSEVNPEPESYHLLTAQLSMDVQKVFSDASLPDMTLSVYGDNLLDEDIYYPEINRKNINSIPIYSGRAYYATVAVKF